MALTNSEHAARLRVVEESAHAAIVQLGLAIAGLRSIVERAPLALGAVSHERAMMASLDEDIVPTLITIHAWVAAKADRLEGGKS